MKTTKRKVNLIDRRSSKNRRPALVICCKDYRYVQAVQRFIKRKLGIPLYDLKATAGGVRAMLDSPRVMRQWILRDIELVYRLHGVRRVIIVQHEDCAAYGGSSKLGNLQQQCRLHQKQFLRASRVLQKEFPNLTVRGFLAYGYPATVRFLPLHQKIGVK